MMNTIYLKKLQPGFLLLEILISFSFFIISITSITLLLGHIARERLQNHERTELLDQIRGWFDTILVESKLPESKRMTAKNYTIAWHKVSLPPLVPLKTGVSLTTRRAVGISAQVNSQKKHNTYAPSFFSVCVLAKNEFLV